MPRTRNSKADSIQILLNNLTRSNEIPEGFHGEIIRSTREKLRILNTKASHPLCKGDSPDAREVATLEFVLRKGVITKNGSEFHIHVPLKEIGKAGGHGKALIEKVSNSVQIYLDDKTLQKPSSTSLGRERGSTRVRKALGMKDVSKKPIKASTGKPSTPLKKRLEAAKVIRQLSKQSNRKFSKTKKQPPLRETIPMKPIRPSQLLHELSLKLQSKLHDPDTCEKASTILYLQLIKYMLSDDDNAIRSMVARRCMRDDIERNSKLYEASCFFIAAKEMEQGRVTLEDITVTSTTPLVHVQPARMQKGKKRGRGRYSLADMDSDAEEDEHALSVVDVAAVLRETPLSLSEFLQGILPKITNMRVKRKDESQSKSMETKSTQKKPLKNNQKRGMKKSVTELDNSLKNCTRQDYIDSIVQKNDNSSNEEATELEADDFINEKMPLSPPHNCKAQYRDQKAFDTWQDEIFAVMTLQGETREDVINRHFAEILKKHSQ